MEDDYRDIGAIARSCNMNKPNNVIAPKLGLKASHVWNYFDRVLSPGMNIFNGSSESVSLDFPIARQERSYDQVSNQQFYLYFNSTSSIFPINRCSSITNNGGTCTTNYNTTRMDRSTTTTRYRG